MFAIRLLALFTDTMETVSPVLTVHYSAKWIRDRFYDLLG